MAKATFDKIVERARASGIWADGDSAANQRGRPYSLSMKMLSVFYIMGLGTAMRCAEAGSGLSDQTIAQFFREFVPWFDHWLPEKRSEDCDDMPEAMRDCGGVGGFCFVSGEVKAVRRYSNRVFFKMR
mmetsp:Transcript_28332/g.47542  ORF Transcript_28332/g.47542 Transcript_28332/m.47542 type:complete len:128 (-) Transcript_28332:122-505(-)